MRAVEMQKRLEAQPVRSRSVAQYERVIREFRAVYWYDFANLKAPVAAEAMGDLYAEMGRVFTDSHYFREAIKAYNYVVSQYPVSSMALDAAISVGKVYLEDLHEPEEAAGVYRTFLEKHPSTPQADIAKKNLKAISEMLARHQQVRSGNYEQASVSTNAGNPVELLGVRSWAGPDFTRVVIRGQSPFKYDTLRLTHPDRIVFDLPNTYLRRSLLGKVIPIDDDFLHDIRVGQFKPNVTRVVLDVKNFENYSAFSLPDPFRLIIDIRGSATRTTNRATYQEASDLSTIPEFKHTSPPSARQRPPAVTSSAKSIRKSEKEAANRIKRSEQEKKVEIASVERKPDELPLAIKPASPTANGSETLTRALGLKVTRIVIDPGHGGRDTGAIGPDGLEEKNVALDIGLRLRRLLETQTDDRVFMTRDTDVFIPLEERTAIANADHADLFISIHCNANRDHHVRGIATYYLNFTTNPQALKVAARENATSQYSVFQLKSLIKKIALNNKIQESEQLAGNVQSILWRRMHRISHGVQNRGVRKAPFVVLIGANMPSVLVETGFITNPHTEHLLSEPSYREQIAKGIFHGIEDYISNLGSIRVAQSTH